jgi:alkylation response protein AidB-like acyl-CoA dehydrogenase
MPQLADGRATAAIAVLEEAASWRPNNIRSVAVRTSSSAMKTSAGWGITTDKHFVNHGNEAPNLVVAARIGDGAQDISLFLIDREAEGIDSELFDHPFGTRTAVLTFNETFEDGARLIREENGGWPLIEEMMLRGAAIHALQLTGLGRMVLGITAAYVKERKKFGVPVGSFQAGQYHLADMAVSVCRVEHMIRQAVWSVAEGRPDRRRQVSRAKSTASQLIPEVCWTAHQCHGAIGFTWEHDLRLYTRRAL